MTLLRCLGLFPDVQKEPSSYYELNKSRPTTVLFLLIPIAALQCWLHFSGTKDSAVLRLEMNTTNQRSHLSNDVDEKAGWIGLAVMCGAAIGTTFPENQTEGPRQTLDKVQVDLENALEPTDSTNLSFCQGWQDLCQEDI